MSIVLKKRREEVMERWSLRMQDRAGALERVLGMLRRRMVALESLTVRRVAGGHYKLDMVLYMEAEKKERIRAELHNIVDVMVAAELGVVSGSNSAGGEGQVGDYA